MFYEKQVSESNVFQNLPIHSQIYFHILYQPPTLIHIRFLKWLHLYILSEIATAIVVQRCYKQPQKQSISKRCSTTIHSVSQMELNQLASEALIYASLKVKESCSFCHRGKSQNLIPIGIPCPSLVAFLFWMISQEIVSNPQQRPSLRNHLGGGNRGSE